MKRHSHTRFLLACYLLLAFSVPFSVPCPVHADDTEGPRRGTLLIVGGGGKQAAAIFRKFVDLAGGAQARIVIVPTAISSDPKYDYQNPAVVLGIR